MNCLKYEKRIKPILFQNQNEIFRTIGLDLNGSIELLQNEMIIIQWFIICILAFYYNLSLMCVVHTCIVHSLYIFHDYWLLTTSTFIKKRERLAHLHREFSHLFRFCEWKRISLLTQHLKERGCFPKIVAQLSEILKLKKIEDICESRIKT